MAGNSFGDLFRFTSWGESHGEAIGCVVDGVPSMISLSEEDIQVHLDRRSPGRKYTSQRRESDKVKILSGVFEGVTTGTPISLMIVNEDQRPKDYSDIKDKFRPGHADYTYYKKYGIRDYRGGGRSSGRETALRVAAGAIARKILGASIQIRGAMTQIGSEAINRSNWNWKECERNPFYSPDKIAAVGWEAYLDAVRISGSSVGAVIEISAEGVPAGLGEPVYNKLDADLAKAIMSINAVKGVEIGAGFAAATIPGELASDEMRMHGGDVAFLSNHAGGILGGISTGQPIIIRFAVKPTSSILHSKKTVDIHGKNTHITVKGRHDPCIGIRAVPVGEAMVACVLAEHYLKHRALKHHSTKQEVGEWL